MGRAKYTAEERKNIIATFIEAAHEIIDEEGVQGASIRKIANRTGFSSATLYLYFNDINELVMLASIDYLEQYCKELVCRSTPDESPMDFYFKSWQLFCKHVFVYPRVFKNLFFSSHAFSVDEVVRRYYSIFPQQLDNINGRALAMVLAGDIAERNLQALRPYTQQIGYSEDETLLINDITVCYFKNYLERAEDMELNPEGIELLTSYFLEGIRFIICGRHVNPSSSCIPGDKELDIKDV